MAQSDWDAIAFINASTYREQVYESLRNGPATPSTIAGEIEGQSDPIARVSRAIKSLQERGLVDLLVSEEKKKGRIYGLTDDGQELAEQYDEFTDR